MNVLTSAKAHLDQACQGSTIDPRVIIGASSILKYGDKPDETVVLGLLSSVVAVLKTGVNEEDGYDALMELLQSLIAQVPFDTVLKYLSVDDLMQGLNGPQQLQRACITLIRQSNPADLVANTPLIGELVRLVGDNQVSSQIANDALNALSELGLKGELVRRRMFTDNGPFAVLQGIKDGHDATLKSRLMDLMQTLVPVLNPVPWGLVVFPLDDIDKNDDALSALALIQFYRHLVENPHPTDLLARIEEHIKRIVNLYLTRDSNFDVQMFLLSEIVSFFGAMSKHEYVAFAQLDEQYNITKDIEYDDRGVVFLSKLDPHYMAKTRPQTLRNLPYKEATTKALYTAFQSQKAYQLVRPTTDLLLRLPPLELVVLIKAMCTPWGLEDLLSMPQVMNYLLHEFDDVRDKTALEFRRQALEKLLEHPPADLGPWYDGIKREYKKIVFGNVQSVDVPQVATESGQ